MNYLDLFFLIPILWGAYKGFSKGLIITIASLLALVIGVWGGLKFSNFTSGYLVDWFNISGDYLPIISLIVQDFNIII